MKPTNSLVNSLLTDLYQITMVYGYWKANRHNDLAVFDLFFRKNPFKGEYTIYSGLDEVLGYLNNFNFTLDDISYLKTLLPDIEIDFFNYLKNLNCSNVKLYSMKEGTIVFPKVPVLIVEGPLGITQLLETCLLNLLNFPSLLTTNAIRLRRAAGDDKLLVEFGLRRAQGPDGAISASKYAYMGGFDATSNLLAGKLFNIPVRGTHAHSYVQSYRSLNEIQNRNLGDIDFVSIVLKYRNELDYNNTNNGELTAFISYAIAFPKTFLALVDTYDTLQSGVPNFVCVALALIELKYKPVGIRLDSGDLAYLSKETREIFIKIENKYFISNIHTENYFPFSKLTIMASNNINEKVLHALNEEGHSIDGYGIGTNLVTCENQPALGMVYKLVSINNNPRIKISQDINKVTIPKKKKCFRFLSNTNQPILDYMVSYDIEDPKPNEKILCRHPFNEMKRVYVIPSKVINLHQLVWDGNLINIENDSNSLFNKRKYIKNQLNNIRSDIIRSLNPTPYKVSVSNELYDYIHNLWLNELPIQELK